MTRLFTTSNAFGALLGLDLLNRAEASLREFEKLLEGFSEPNLRIRYQWSAANLVSRLGRSDEADRYFACAREALRERWGIHDIGMLSLEIAEGHLHWGETRKARRRVEEALPIFRELGLPFYLERAERVRQQASGA